MADCCGILGVFIGFNFLMVWDLLLLCLKNIQKMETRYKRRELNFEDSKLKLINFDFDINNIIELLAC